jgi:hypothetical protein
MPVANARARPAQKRDRFGAFFQRPQTVRWTSGWILEQFLHAIAEMKLHDAALPHRFGESAIVGTNAAALKKERARTSENVPISHARNEQSMGSFSTKLAIVDTLHAGASLLSPQTLPVFIGSEQGDLICGGCEAVVCKSISPRTLKNRFGAPNQLILLCPLCNAYNVLPSTLISQP